MKMVMTIVSLLTILSTVSAHADTEAVGTLKALGLSEFYCDAAGITQKEPVFNFVSTTSIFAQDDKEAIKLCLLKIDALKVGEAGDTKLMARIKTLSSDSVYINKISVRPGFLK